MSKIIEKLIVLFLLGVMTGIYIQPQEHPDLSTLLKNLAAPPVSSQAPAAGIKVKATTG